MCHETEFHQPDSLRNLNTYSNKLAIGSLVKLQASADSFTVIAHNKKLTKSSSSLKEEKTVLSINSVICLVVVVLPRCHPLRRSWKTAGLFTSCSGKWAGRNKLSVSTPRRGPDSSQGGLQVRMHLLLGTLPGNQPPGEAVYRSTQYMLGPFSPKTLSRYHLGWSCVCCMFV